MSSTPSQRSDQLLALRQTWAQDEETRLDLSTFGHDLVGALHMGAHAPSPSRLDIQLFRDLSAMPPQELPSAPSMNSGAARVLRAFLDTHASTVLHTARRRWAQSLALAGAFDFNADSDDFSAAFSQAAELGAHWYLKSHPDFKQHDERSLTRPLADQIQDAKRDCAQVFMQSLLRLGREMEIDSFVDKTVAQLIAIAKRNHGGRGAGYLHPADNLHERLRSAVEKAWIAEGALSRAPASLSKQPRL